MQHDYEQGLPIGKPFWFYAAWTLWNSKLVLKQARTGILQTRSLPLYHYTPYAILPNLPNPPQITMQNHFGWRSSVFDIWLSLFLGQYCDPTKHDRVKSIHVMNSTMYGLQRLLKMFPCQRTSFLTSWHGKRIEKTTCRSFLPSR